MRILIFTATYNEADNIETIVFDIHEQVPEADVLVVDDASPDGTGALLDRLAQSDPNLRPVHRPAKLGLGTAHLLAMKYAMQEGYDILISMDADYSHHPKYLPTLLHLLDENDFVIGSRYMKGGRCDYGFIRSFVSMTANLLVRVFLSIPTYETTTAFRGFHVSLLRKMDLDSVRSEGYSFMMEIIYLVHRISRRMGEFPIHFEDRRAGTSKISKQEIIKAVYNLARLVFRRFFILPWRRKPPRERPSRPFIPCETCQSPYHMEMLEAQHAEQNDTSVYCCTSMTHRTHGRILKCLHCGLVFNEARHDPQKILDFYTEVEDAAYLKNIESRFKTFRYNFSKIKKFLPNSGRLLDVGTYCGVSLKVAREFGFEPLGVEPSKWAAQYCRDVMQENVIQGTVADLPEEAGQFDVVTLWDVFEHFFHPIEELHHMNSRMKPGGILCLSTLNIDNWYPKLLQDRWPWYMDMHLYYFTPDTLRQMLEKTDFELLHHEGCTHIITLEYFFLKLEALGVWGAGRMHRWVQNTPLKNLMLPFRFGDVQLFVCRKK